MVVLGRGAVYYERGTPVHICSRAGRIFLRCAVIFVACWELPSIELDRLRAGRGAARAEDAQGTPTQIHVSTSLLVYADK